MNKVKKLNSFLLIAFFSAWAASAKDSTTIKMSSGFVGGTYHQVALTLASLPGLRISIEESRGSKDNLEAIRDGKADLGLAQLDVYEDYLKTGVKFKNKVKVLLPVYSEEVHVLAPRSIRKLREIAGKKISIGPDGSGIQATSRHVMDLLGYTTDESRLDKSDTKTGLKKLRAGEVDILFVVAGAPVKFLKDLDASVKDSMHLLSFRGREIRTLRRKAFGLKKARIRRKVYPWLRRNIRTVSVDSALFVKSDMKDWQVEDLIRKIFNNHVDLFLSHEKWKELDIKKVKRLADARPEIFHPAALRTIATYK